MSTLRIGTRGSRLALWQANWVRDQILARYPDLKVELIPIKTQGDIILDRPLAEIGGKGLFVKELEVAMLENRTDMAVHSMKDVPAILPEGLEISVITQRESPRDALISPGSANLETLPKGAVIGTSSLRRGAQLKAYRPDLEIRTLRGNVDTRLKKVTNGEYDGAIMAVAGLKRLQLEAHIAQELPFSVMLPAIAQGAIGIETRMGDEATVAYLSHLQHDETYDCLIAEREVLHKLEGNCQIPVAGYCTVDQNQLHLEALVAQPEGLQVIRREASAPRHNARELGEGVAQQILEEGGSKILQTLSTF